jgi:hypothetical protein
MNVYIARNPGPAHQNDAIVAGVATHNESGFIQVRALVTRSEYMNSNLFWRILQSREGWIQGKAHNLFGKPYIWHAEAKPPNPKP